jgi:hypothetical protein
MRDGLGGIVKFRCLDAIALENKHCRIPLEPKVCEVKRNEDPDTVPTDRRRAREVSYLVPAPEPEGRDAADDGFLWDDAVSATRPVDPAHFAEMGQLEEHVDVQRVLTNITDDRKRLAFHLYMDGYPFGSTRTLSIAKAVGISSKTAEVWIAELIELLRQTREFQELTNKKVES